MNTITKIVVNLMVGLMYLIAVPLSYAGHNQRWLLEVPLTDAAL